MKTKLNSSWRFLIAGAHLLTVTAAIAAAPQTISKYARRTGRTVVATAGLAFLCTIGPGWAEQFTIAVVADTQCYTKSDGNMAVLLSQVLRPLSTISGELHIGPSE